MTVREYFLSDGRHVHIDGSQNPISGDEIFEEAVRVGVLCNEASFRAESKDKTHTVCYPTETALLGVADTLVLYVSHERSSHPNVSEQPFHSSTRRMTTLHRKTNGR